jgi:hypothetical protein
MADVLIRIRGRASAAAGYPVEAQLADGSRHEGTPLVLDRGALLAAESDPDASRYGRLLFEALCTGPVGVALRTAIEGAGDDGARIRLEIDPAAPELEAIRWERLYRERRGTWVPASTAGDTPFSRYRALPTAEPRAIATRPVRILLAVSNPTNLPGGLQPIEVAEEIETLRQAFRAAAATDDVDVTVLPGRTGLPPELVGSLEADGFTIVDGPTTLPQLVRRLSDSHIVHLVAHGAYRAPEPDQPPESALFLEDQDGAWDPVTATQLVERFAATEAAPALVYLSACETGRAADALGHPFLGLAPRLVDAGAAAVVAMQAPVPVATARTLTFDFYRELLERGVVDVALNAARGVVFDPDRLHWTIPVLFSRLREGRLLVAHDLAQLVVADDVAIAPEAEHGVVANRVGVVPVARPRPAPVLRLPRDFPDLLGREAEVGGVLGVLGDARGLLEIHGGPGIGKTVLLRHVANRAQGAAPGGVIHVARGGEPVHDLLQYLFDSLFEAPASLRPTDADLERLLADRAPLVVMDDADLDRDALGQLIALVPGATFLFAASERNLWGEGHAIALDGLPPDASLALFERNLGRPLAAGEQARALELCGALGGWPLHVLQAADQVARGTWPPLPMVSADGEPVPEPWVARPAAELDDAERRVLGIVAAAGGPIRLERIEAVSGLPDAEVPCVRLRRAGRIRTASPRYELAAPLPQGDRDALEVPRWRALLLAHLVTWVEQNQNSPGTLLRDLDTILGVLDSAGPADDPRLVQRLARGAEGPLILAKRWERWRDVLDREEALATATGDRAAIAWVRHQQGSRALALQDERTARSALQEALAIRDELGDVDGAARTRHNLELLGPPPASGDDSSSDDPGPRPRPDPKPGPRRPWLRPLVLGVATVAVVGAGLLAARAAGWPPATPTEPPPVTEPPTPPGLFVPVPGFSPDGLAFGEVEIGSVSEQAVTLSNDGDVALDIEAIALEPELDGLEVGSDCGSSLPAGASCVISVTFRPSTEGERATELVLSGNLPEGRARIPVTARALAPPGTGALTIEPPAVEFGAIPLRTTARSEVTLVSTGTAEVTLLDIGLFPARIRRAGTFALDDRSPPGDPPAPSCAVGMTLPVGAACRIGVDFTPRGADPVVGEILIEDDSPSGTHSVSLTGAGLLGLADLQVSIDIMGEPTPREGGLTGVPIIVIVRNGGDVEATSGAIVAFAGEPGWSDPAAGFMVALLADKTDGVEQVGGFRPAVVRPIAPGESFAFTGSLLFGEFFAGRPVEVVVDVDSCAGLEIFDPEVLRRCEVAEIDEENNRSNPLTFDLGALATAAPIP